MLMWLVTGGVVCAATAVTCAMICNRRRYKADSELSFVVPCQATAVEPDAVEPDVGFQALYLSCPHCSFCAPLDDLSLVGAQVDCPLCEESFEVLEPQPAAV